MAQEHPAGLVTRTGHGDGAHEINRTFGSDRRQLPTRLRVAGSLRRALWRACLLALSRQAENLRWSYRPKKWRASFPPCISPRPGGWVETLARSLKRGSVASAVEPTSWDGRPTARPTHRRLPAPAFLLGNSRETSMYVEPASVRSRRVGSRLPGRGFKAPQAPPRRDALLRLRNAGTALALTPSSASTTGLAPTRNRISRTTRAGALCMECVMALFEITACKYETRDGRGFAVATAADGSHWEYELFEGGDGSEFCRSILERGSIVSELWQQVGDPAGEELRENGSEEGLERGPFSKGYRGVLNTPGERGTPPAASAARARWPFSESWFGFVPAGNRNNPRCFFAVGHRRPASVIAALASIYAACRRLAPACISTFTRTSLPA